MSKLQLWILLFLLTAIGCKPDRPSSIFSSWSATKVEIEGGRQSGTEGLTHDSQIMKVSEFGSATLTIHPDSTYEVHIDILKDVRVKRMVFGNEVTETVVPAIYKSMRKGVAQIRDSSLTLFDENHAILVSCIYKIWPGELAITFTDAKHQTWWSSWKEQ